MIQEVIRALETGVLAEVGLVAFVVAFTLVVVRAFLLPKRDRDDAKQMPLDDGEAASPFPTQPEPAA